MNQPINLVLLMLVIIGAAIPICTWVSPDLLDVLSRKAKARAAALRSYRAHAKVAKQEMVQTYERVYRGALVADSVEQMERNP